MAKAETADQVEVQKPEARWASRIVGHGEERPDQLMAHPENWRIHTKQQKEALAQLLDKVGWVQNVVVNTTTQHVLDGHLRVGEAIARGEASVPVTYVELSEDEERLVLASLDPIASLAVTDDAALTGLISSVDADGELERLLRDTAGMSDAARIGVDQNDIDNKTDDLENAIRTRANQANDNIVDIECPHCGQTIGVDKSVLGGAK